jgi:hypothetical protein
MEHRSSRGKILYRGDQLGERGREWFHRTDYADGTHLFRTISEIDDSQIRRDVIYATDAHFRPRECYQRLVVRGNLSTAWFTFERDYVRCEGQYFDLGRVSQQLALTQPPSYLACHPLVGDCLVVAGYDFARGGRQVLHGVTTSPTVNGSTGPIATLTSHPVEYVGWETVETAVGPVGAHHFRIFYGPGNARWEEIWCGADFSFVRVRNDELATTYELVELEQWSHRLP